jgi:hypothetical protein
MPTSVEKSWHFTGVAKDQHDKKEKEKKLLK